MTIPRATYRLQLNHQFPFAKVEAILDYLRDLGVSHIYASPILQARAGSDHGYDVVDPTQINPELGTRGDFESLLDKCRAHGLGWVQDIVPNHMAYSMQNPFLADVMENGPHSRFAHFFDIEWDHAYESMNGRVLAPFLGGLFGDVLERGELKLRFDDGTFRICYYDSHYPISIESYATLLGHDQNRLKRRLGDENPDFVKYLGVLYVLKNIENVADATERHDQGQFAKSVLSEAYKNTPEIRAHIDHIVEEYNGTPGEPESFNLLDALLGEQYFRLSFWKVASEELNYRRFFTINELISLRIEDEEVFDATHNLILRFCQEDRIDGLRVDHIDGLYDPSGYLRSLDLGAGNRYLVVEKILAPGEPLPTHWEIEGTTGYDFLNHLSGIFIDRSHQNEIERIYAEFLGVTQSYDGLIYSNKRFVTGKRMAGDVERLAMTMKSVASNLRHGSDITMYGLKRALVELLTTFPVYRTYIDSEEVSPQDRATIERAIQLAIAQNADLTPELRFVEDLLLLDYADLLDEKGRAASVDFIKRFQQLTGPLMAKGVEDCFFYIYNSLISLNEVGAEPRDFGCSTTGFHTFIMDRQSRWPHSMNATATHDTKRGEDVRARLNVLSEIPREWEERVHEWRQINGSSKRQVNGVDLPDSNAEYFIYQSLLGTWPLDGESSADFGERFQAYFEKAAREASTFTNWSNPDTEYEKACRAFIDEILDERASPDFHASFRPFAERVAHFGCVNSLSQTLMKIATPGVPDIYQGTEFWDLSFVDPDNRRPVDYDRRRWALSQVQHAQGREQRSALLARLLDDQPSGLMKFFVLYEALQARKREPHLYENGSYVPLEFTGAHAGNLLGFCLHYSKRWALVIVPRLTTSLVGHNQWPMGGDVWEDTRIMLPESCPTSWINRFSGLEMTVDAKQGWWVHELLHEFPVALLEDWE